MRPERVRIGQISIDAVTRSEALDAICALVEAGQGGGVFTPNVDHIVLAETNRAFRDAYEGASLSLVDGTPLLWAAQLLRTPLPERLSGSDLIIPLMNRAAARHYRVYLLGAGPGVGRKAADALLQTIPVEIVGVDSPQITLEPGQDAEVVERIRKARPHLIFVALGAPKQEIWIHRTLPQIRPAVALGIGAGLDFIAGTIKRAPYWVSRAGFEWLYRLGREPRRLWRRYLVRDPRFALVLLKMLL